MVAVLESKTRVSFPATKERWDLKDRSKFPQWHHDLIRIVKRSTTPTFLGSSPPAFEEPVYTSARSTSRRAAADVLRTQTAAHACTIDEWMQHNAVLYDIIMASITLTEDQFVHVDQGVGQHSDGNALYDWVLTHADDRKLSAQIHLKEVMKTLSISEQATAEEVDDAFRTIEINWPKIIGYDNSSAAPSIEFAISLFPRAYMHRPYIAALQVYHDGGGRWAKFSDFRAEVVERLKCCDARDPPPAQQAAFPVMHAQALHSRMLANFKSWFPGETVRVFRADSFSTNRSKAIVEWFESGMIACQFTPPGQHAFLTVERWWYPLLTGALVALRHGRAPKNQWYNAMRHQLDVECTLVSRDAPESAKTTAYERATDIVKVRADAAAACNMAARYAHAPSETAVRCMKYLIFYLLATPDLGLTFGGGAATTAADLVWSAPPSHDGQLQVDEVQLAYHVVCDGDLRIDRSVSGIIHKFAGAAISVQSVRQHSIAIDAHSSECFTASTAACQAVVHRGILVELRINQDVPTPVFSDSRSTLLVAQNAAALRKSIYILRRVLYMREAVDNGEVSDFYSCAGGTNPADPLTKYVAKSAFAASRRFMMGQ